MGVFTGGGGGGSFHPRSGVFAVSGDFSDYGVPLVGVCYTLSESHRKGVFGDVGFGGGSIFLRNSARIVKRSGVFSRCAQGFGALFRRAVQCRLILRSMVFRRGGVLYLFGTVFERAFQRCMGWGRVGDDIFDKLGWDGHGLCRDWICQSPGSKNMQQRQKKREWPQHTIKPHPNAFKNGFPTPKMGGGGCLTHQKPMK